jgi:hypothetical protein
MIRVVHPESGFWLFPIPGCTLMLYLGQGSGVGCISAGSGASGPGTDTTVQRQRIGNVLKVRVELGPVFHHHVLHHLLNRRRKCSWIYCQKSFTATFSRMSILYQYEKHPFWQCKWTDLRFVGSRKQAKIWAKSIIICRELTKVISILN